MLLALDIGNSQIFGGILENSEIKLRFRKTSKSDLSSDELGVFLKTVLKENGFDPGEVKDISVCSVVPELLHTVNNCCKKYFNTVPFVLGVGVKTGLNIKYKNPAEVGADRIANAIGAVNTYPAENLIIIDFGTANTFCVVSKNSDYLGGIIWPGIKTAMNSLAQNTALLPAVEIIRPKELVGRTTETSIQSGLFYGNLATIKEISRMIKEIHFKGENVRVIGTGGFARLFENENIFDIMLPDLVLTGLYTAHKLNRRK